MIRNSAYCMLPRLLSACIGALLALPFAAAPAQSADAPTAIVEDADPGRTDIGLFEMLQNGHKISLKKGEQLILGYLQSCMRETITGGEVVVGAKKSAVTGGQVNSEKVECAGGQVALDKSSKGKAGVVVFRKAPKKKKSRTAKTKTLTLHDTSPLVRLKTPAAAITLQRLDEPGPPENISVSGNTADLRAEGIKLAPGGSYVISAGKRRVRLKVAPDARDGLRLLERLVLL